MGGRGRERETERKGEGGRGRGRRREEKDKRLLLCEIVTNRNVSQSPELLSHSGSARMKLGSWMKVALDAHNVVGRCGSWRRSVR